MIDAQGRVDRNAIRILATPNLGFSGPARTAAATCRYHPGRKDGAPVMVRMRREILFDYRRVPRTREKKGE